VANETEVLDTIRSIARTELELEQPVEPGDDLLADLGLDSLGLTVLAVGLENRFRVKLSQEDAVGLRTVGDLAQLVVRRAEASS
jgi:acyl carrier protein